MLFTIQLIISFAAGGLLIALQTLIGERVPLRWRGIALTIPTTMALGLFFVGLTKSAADIPEVALIMPAALIPAYVFVMLFAILSQLSLTLALITAYLTWGGLAYALIKFPPETFAASTFLYALPILIIAYLIVRKLPQTTTLKQYPMNWKHISIRSLIGGSIILIVVILSKTLGNIWGGLFSMFPASYSSTFIIYYTLQGRRVIPSIAKSLFWPGIPGFITYAFTASVTFPEYGIWLGTLASYAVTLSFLWLYNHLGTLSHKIEQPPHQHNPR